MKASTAPKKVLVVEDEGDMCLLLNIMLTGKDMSLDHVKSIKAAEAYLKAEQPNVVLLDNKLTDGFGVDFIPQLKQLAPQSKVVMISGYDGSVKDLALENGADEFLSKPFTKEQLFSTIKKLVAPAEATAA